MTLMRPYPHNSWTHFVWTTAMLLFNLSNMSFIWPGIGWSLKLRLKLMGLFHCSKPAIFVSVGSCLEILVEKFCHHWGVSFGGTLKILRWDALSTTWHDWSLGGSSLTEMPGVVEQKGEGDVRVSLKKGWMVRRNKCPVPDILMKKGLSVERKDVLWNDYSINYRMWIVSTYYYQYKLDTFALCLC